MAPNLFSLTNALLATSFLFALTNGAPIPKALDPERDSVPLPSRDMWSEVAAVRPRYSSIDNLRVSPPAKSAGRVLPKWIEATFDPNEPVQSEKLSKRTPIVPHFTIGAATHVDGEVRTPFLPRIDVGTVRGPGTPVLGDDDNLLENSRGPGTPVLNTDGDLLPHARIGVALEDRNAYDSYVSEGSSEDVDVVSKKPNVWKEVGSRDVKLENSQFGPTETYSGSLWRRSLKRDLLP